KEQQITRFTLKTINDSLYLFSGHEFGQGGSHFAGRTDGQRNESFGTQRTGKFGQFLYFFAAITTSARHANTFYYAVGGQHALEDAKVASRRQVSDLDQRQVEAQVGMVGAVAVHDVLVAQARERLLFDALIGGLSNEVDQQAFDERHDVSLIDESHFQVKIGRASCRERVESSVVDGVRERQR